MVLTRLRRSRARRHQPTQSAALALGSPLPHHNSKSPIDSGDFVTSGPPVSTIWPPVRGLSAVDQRSEASRGILLLSWKNMRIDA
jgi:hypothetical protein